MQADWDSATVRHCWWNMGSPLHCRDETTVQTTGGNGHETCFKKANQLLHLTTDGNGWRSLKKGFLQSAEALFCNSF